MCRQHRLRLDPLDPLLALLDPLRQIPQKEVDQHATDLPRGARLAVLSAQRRRDALDRHDRRGAYGDLLAGGAADEELARAEGARERGGVREQAEVVQDLRDAVVGEHGQLRDAAREERVRIRGAGVAWVERGPGLRGQDLRALPEENCFPTNGQGVGGERRE